MPADQHRRGAERVARNRVRSLTPRVGSLWVRPCARRHATAATAIAPRPRASWSTIRACGKRDSRAGVANAYRDVGLQTFRVHRALGRTGAPGKELALEYGSVIRGRLMCRVFWRGGWYCEDVKTSLPYVETTI